METLAVGTRIFNGGDMANPEHFGTIIEVIESKWGTDYRIQPDQDSDRTKPYVVPKCIVSPEYSGNGSTRIVTEDAYWTWRNARIEAMKANVLKAIGRKE